MDSPKTPTPDTHVITIHVVLETPQGVVTAVTTAEPFTPDLPRKQAIAMLKGFLANGPQTADAVKERADSLGISSSTLARAKEELQVKSTKMGFGAESVWVWSLAAEPGQE